MVRTFYIVSTATSLALVSGCATAPLQPIPVHHTPWNRVASASLPDSLQSPSPGPDPDRPLPQLPPEVAPPSKVACSFDAAQWSKPLHLGLSARSLYATLDDAQEVHVQIPVGSASQGAHVEVLAGGIYFVGIIPPTDVDLLPSKPFAVAECLVPTSSTPLTWEKASPGRIRVRLPMDSRVHLARGEPAADRSCQDLSLSTHSFRSSDIFGPEEPPYRALRKGTSSLSLSATADGRRVATIDLSSSPIDDDSLMVMVLGETRTRTRIGWVGDEQLVFGWVESSTMDLNHEPTQAGLLAAGTMWGTPSDPWEVDEAPTEQTDTACAWNAPLIAQVGNERAVVGRILPGTVLDMGDREGRFRHVRIRLTTMTPASGATLLVPEAQLYPCPQR